MKQAMTYFKKTHVKVKDVSKEKSYDLECTANNGILRVEVKGTTSSGRAVFLTHREVRLAKAHDVALFVLHSIQLKGGTTPAGGVAVVISPWKGKAGNLTPITYRFVLPKSE